MKYWGNTGKRRILPFKYVQMQIEFAEYMEGKEMAQPLDYVEYLSREIGARPAGTEEEQQAALYIADEFQKESGFSAAIEEFTSSSNLEGYRAILAMVTIVVSILAMLFNILTGPAFVLATASAIIYALEAFGRPIISKPLSRGASQNVVAKYQPHGNQGEGRRGMRTRKIVLLAHYDSGKVTPKIVRAAEKTGLPLGMICLGGMVAAAFFLLLRVFVGGTGGVGLILINILTIIAIIIVALPVVKAILYRVAPYNEGANNNATGVAALLEIAHRINQGSVSEADLADAEGVVIHGEQAALEGGFVPDGTQLSYEVEPNAYEVADDASEEDRLLAAKAAIAAMTGQYVEQRVYATPSETAQMRAVQQGEPFAGYGAAASEAAVDESLVDESNAPDLTGLIDTTCMSASSIDAPLSTEELSQNVAAELQRLAEPTSPDETGGFQNAPSWFVSAQRNAKRSESSEPIQRSAYTEAITAAEQELAERERAKAEEERVRLDTELREAARAAASSVGLANAGVIGKEESPVAVTEEAVVEEPEQPSIEFAPIDLDAFNNQAPIVDLEPIDVSDQGVAATVVPAQPGPAEQPADPSQTVAYIPDHLRALLHKRSNGNEEEVDASIEANGAAAVVSSLASDELVYDGEDDAAIEDEKAYLADEAEDIADAAADPQDVAQDRLAELPTIDESEQKPQVAENTNPSRSGLFRMLRSDVPSLSGAFTPVESAPAESASVEKPRKRLTKADLPSLSGIIDPVGVEPQPEVAPRRRPSLDGLDVPAISAGAAIADAEAVDYEMQLPVSDELAQAAEAALEPQEDQPASLEQLEQLASTERTDFEAESIAMDGAMDDEPAEQDDLTEWDNQANWDVQANWDDDAPIAPKPAQVEMPSSRAGGFFNRFRRKEENLEQTPQEWLDIDEDFEAREVGRERGSWESFRTDDDEQYGDRSWEGGAFSRVRLGHVDMRSEAENEEIEPDTSIEAADDQALNEEIEQIYHFRNPAYESDIWFVAIGSETELHDGARAFIEAHKSELRGAMFVEIESLGLGELCYATEEGQFRRFKSSSRIKRFTRDATAATGISLGQISTSSDSITTTIQKEGFQAMHLMGVEDGAPSLKGSADDIIENVDELIFEENINYLMELMKQK